MSSPHPLPAAQAPQGMHDSGSRQSFSTGAVRDLDADKPRPDLFSPFAEERVGAWLARGARKYAERNWEKGMPISRCLASLRRHVMRFQQGQRDEDHLAAIVFNAMAIMHYEAMIERGVLPAELADLPSYRPHNTPDGFLGVPIKALQVEGTITLDAIGKAMAEHLLTTPMPSIIVSAEAAALTKPDKEPDKDAFPTAKIGTWKCRYPVRPGMPCITGFCVHNQDGKCTAPATEEF